MQEMKSLKNCVFTAMCISLCIVLPQALHVIPNAGSIFLPMHIPVLLCGLICGAPFGLMCGVIGPLLSSIITGMPPAAVLPSMIVECTAYGCFAGLFMTWVYTGNSCVDLHISLLSAMLIGRIAAGITKALIFTSGEMSLRIWITAHFITSFPGIIIQIALLPAVIHTLEKAHLIPYRYHTPETEKFNKNDVISFFDHSAHTWDTNLIKCDEKINCILDNAGITEGIDVLDVACGTGVMIPYYLERNVASVTAIDISPEMVKIAKSKFQQNNVNILCSDIEETVFEKKFDCIVVYNAFPHFPDPEKLIERLSSLLKPNGYLTVAHGMSREQIDNHHKMKANKISLGLMHEDKLAEIFQKTLTLTTKISNEHMYEITGCKQY